MTDIDSLFVAPPLPDHCMTGYGRFTYNQLEAYGLQCFRTAFDQKSELVFLVATGIVHEGRETYTRHEGKPPPNCDSEKLYTRPPPIAAQSAALEKAKAALSDIADNYDHDSDAHKYGTHCRVCVATEAIAAIDAAERNNRERSNNVSICFN